MKGSTRYIAWIFILFLLHAHDSVAQVTDRSYYKPLEVRLDEEGDAYIRFLLWNQAWLTTRNLSDGNGGPAISASIRRSRLIAYARMSPRFLILTHIGLNSLDSENLSALGNDGDGPQIFLHGAWSEYRVNDHIFVGAGLHYWNGLTRLASLSTISMMTMDQSRPFYAWHSLGISDQFARHLGVYLKGAAGRVEYRVAINNPGRSPLAEGRDLSAHFHPDGQPLTDLVYNGSSITDAEGKSRGTMLMTGYVKYNLLEKESVLLPYYAGTHLGEKKVLAIGTGFFWHPDGMYHTSSGTHASVLHFAGDLFLDIPVNGGAVNTYLAVTSFNYGAGYMCRWAGTGTTYYGQAGYYYKKLLVMPYLAYSHGLFEGARDPVRSLSAGVNYFISGHHAKLTLEWFRIWNDYREKDIVLGESDRQTQVRLQLQVAL